MKENNIWRKTSILHDFWGSLGFLGVWGLRIVGVMCADSFGHHAVPSLAACVFTTAYFSVHKQPAEK